MLNIRKLIMKLRRSEYYFSLLFLLLNCCLAANDYDNHLENCKTSGVPGKCRLITDCPVALESLKNTRSHKLKRCGFDDFTEIVCCPEVTAKGPDDTIQQTRFTYKRRCEQACDELSKGVKSKIGWNILGGVNARIEEFPHMAALGYETEEGVEWDCGASIISERYLLTAAHCIANSRRIKPKIARTGVTRLNETAPKDYIIVNITINPNYEQSTKHNDIALLKVSDDMTFSEKIYPACLYFDHDDPLGLIVTGWGKTTISNEDDRSITLQKAMLVPVALRQCNISYVTKSSGSYSLTSTQLCAYANRTDACWGDSGGPLQIQNRAGSYSIVGVISYGSGCGGTIPGVYTRVSKYLEWIENLVWP